MRTHPVIRSEVRVDFWRKPEILAIPFDACRQDGGLNYPLAELFEPVMAEIADEGRAWKAEHDRMKAHYKESGLPVGDDDEDRGPPQLAGHEFRYSYEHTCRECDAEFLVRSTWGGFFETDLGFARCYFCSNACLDKARKRSVAHAQAKVIERRSVERRKARVGLRCQKCGEPLKADRRSKRYCSVKCRVAALRARRHNHPPEVQARKSRPTGVRRSKIPAHSEPRPG